MLALKIKYGEWQYCGNSEVISWVSRPCRFLITLTIICWFLNLKISYHVFLWPELLCWRKEITDVIVFIVMDAGLLRKQFLLCVWNFYLDRDPVLKHLLCKWWAWDFCTVSLYAWYPDLLCDLGCISMKWDFNVREKKFLKQYKWNSNYYKNKKHCVNALFSNNCKA